MSKTPVLIVCKLESDLGGKIHEAVGMLPEAQLLWATDLPGVEWHLQQRQQLAFVVIDTALEALTGSEIVKCVRASDKGNTVPIVFIIEERGEAEHLYGAFGPGVVDCLPVSVPTTVLKNKALLLIEMHSLRARVKQHTVDCGAKILEIEVLHQELEEKRCRLEQLSSLERENVVSQVSSFVTISVGGTMVRPSLAMKLQDFLDKAESALTSSKAAGRNQIFLV